MPTVGKVYLRQILAELSLFLLNARSLDVCASRSTRVCLLN
jgi:hypothetical protein